MESSIKTPKIMPNAEEIEFKENFIERYKKLTDFEEFRKYSLSFLKRSIRVNTLKIPLKELKERLERKWKLEQIPWCKEGFWISHKETDRRDIGNMLEHALGYFYVQEVNATKKTKTTNPIQTYSQRVDLNSLFSNQR